MLNTVHNTSIRALSKRVTRALAGLIASARKVPAPMALFALGLLDIGALRRSRSNHCPA